MYRGFLVILSVVCMAASGSLARAAVITQTQGFVGNPTLRKTVEFDRFNPANGKLVSAEWRLILEIDGGTQAVDNDGTKPETVAVYLGARGSLLSTDVNLFDGAMKPILSGDNAVIASTSSTYELADDNGDGDLFDPTGPDAATHQGTFASTQAAAFVNSAYLDDYVGTQLFQLRVEVEQFDGLSFTDGLSNQITPVLAMPNVVLIYEFNPVPEPSCHLMFLSGACGLAMLVLRTQKT